MARQDSISLETWEVGAVTVIVRADDSFGPDIPILVKKMIAFDLQQFYTSSSLIFSAVLELSKPEQASLLVASQSMIDVEFECFPHRREKELTCMIGLQNLAVVSANTIESSEHLLRVDCIRTSKNPFLNVLDSKNPLARRKYGTTPRFIGASQNY